MAEATDRSEIKRTDLRWKAQMTLMDAVTGKRSVL